MTNYQITAQDDLVSGGAKTKAKKNLAAIKLLKDLENSGRPASTAEQSTLVQYAGWGAAPDIFTGKPAWTELQAQAKELLTEEEYSAARRSTLNAFYTDPDIVSAVYKGIERLGFAGGKVLDPSMGATGMFEGLMPTNMAEQSEITGIERDHISGRIASYLYPDETIHIDGFQDVDLPNDYFDLTISNIPFGEVGVSDPNYKGVPNKTLHDYFFAKGLDTVRPGGLVAYITSTGTMQSARGRDFRRYLSQKANLVGAMRLPGDAFRKIANTSVTTDLVILQKLGDGVLPNNIKWTELKETTVLGAEGQALKTNEYFAANPQLMFGELADDTLHPGRLALKGDGRDIVEAIERAFSQMPAGIYQQTLNIQPEQQRITIPPELQNSVKENAYAVYENQLVLRKGSQLQPVELEGKRLERVKGLIRIREAVQTVFEVQGRQGTDSELQQAQDQLNGIYDKFVKKNGCISRLANKLVFASDPDYPLLLALENYDRNTKTATKTDIFTKRTIQSYVPKEHADTAKEGLLYSLNEKGRVDTAYISQLTGKSRLEVVIKLQEENLIFRDPSREAWQTRDEYLSGNVKKKLVEAREASKGDRQYLVNVEQLELVQPAPIPPGDIDVRLGAAWVPASDIEAFTQQLLKVDEGVNIYYSKESDAWYVEASNTVKISAANNKVHGTGRVPATKLISLALNLRTPVVYNFDRDNKKVLDVEETTAAKLKFEGIREKFVSWVWQDVERTERLTQKYNELFNTHKERTFDGSHLELPGKNPNITLRPHQLNGVYRSFFGNTLFAHVVGAGKTFTMIASAMERKRLALCQKPMVVVPNHLLEQISRDFKLLYPASNILAATKDDATPKNRQELMGRIATGNWDAVIVTHASFEKLKLSDQAQTKFYKEACGEIEEAIYSVRNEDDSSRRLMKDLERQKEKLENKINEIANNPAKDNAVTFEQLGIDSLSIDESHYFKNLGYTTKMRSVAGLPNTNSQRAFDMYMKTRYMSEVNGEGKGIIFSTGTPIANSMAELYTLQRYLQPEELDRMGLSSFDSWASVFGETVTAPELSAAGKFKVKTRFARFVNLPELMTTVRLVMDVQTQDMLDLPVPKLVGGKPTIVAVPATDTQLDYMTALAKRAENLSNVRPDEDNMLKITGEGRKASLDMRLISEDYPDDPDSKVNQFVRDAFNYWTENGQDKTHLAFCDFGTPKAKGEFSIYQDIKDKLVERGMPAEQIAFAQSYKSDKKKLELQSKFNKGEITLIISGSQLETGFNGQKRLGLLSHLTVPWRPDQLTQRRGRAERQGNRNAQVEVVRYTTQGRNGQYGFDGYMWQTVETKAKYINQAITGSTTQRAMEDSSAEELNYSEIKAISTGNPLIMEKAKVDDLINRLSVQKRAHINNQFNNRNELERIPERISKTEEKIKALTADTESIRVAFSEGTVEILGKTLSLDVDKEEIGRQIRSTVVLLEKPTKSEETKNKTIGKLGDLRLSVVSYSRGAKYDREAVLSISGMSKHAISKGIRTSNLGTFETLSKKLRSEISDDLTTERSNLTAHQKDLEDLSQTTEQPFAQENELITAKQRLTEIHAELEAIDKEKNSEESREQNSTPISTDSTASASHIENQPEGKIRAIAEFIENQGLYEEIVLSTQGFDVTLLNASDNEPLFMKSTGSKLTLGSAIAPSGDFVTIRLDVSKEGILSDPEKITNRERLKGIKLAGYMSANTFSPELTSPDEEVESEDISLNKGIAEERPPQSPNKVESDAIAHEEKTFSPIGNTPGQRRTTTVGQKLTPTADLTANRQSTGTTELQQHEATQEAKDTESEGIGASLERKPQSETDQDRVFVRIQTHKLGNLPENKLSGYVAEFIVKHDLRKEVLSKKESNVVFKDPRNNTLTTITTKAAQPEEVPHLSISPGAQILAINSEADWGDGNRPIPIQAQFLIKESGRLQCFKVSSPVPKNKRVDSIESRLGVYLALVELDKQPALETAHKDTGTSVVAAEGNALTEKEPVVLRIKSLYSGKEEELVLPETAIEAEQLGRSKSPVITEESSQRQLSSDAKIDESQQKSNDGINTEPEDKSNELTIYENEFITVSREPGKEGIEVRFSEKPSEEWTQKLGKQGLKFSFTKKGGDARWYKKEAQVSLPSITSLAEKYSQSMAATAQEIPAAEKKEQKTLANQTQPREKKSAQRDDSKLRPGFKRYLEWKEKHPDSIILVKTPGTYYEAYKEDAVATSELLGIGLSTIPSKSEQYGRVNISRVFESSSKSLIAKLQKQYSVIEVGAENTATVHPQSEKEIKPLPVREARQQSGYAEKNIAKLVHDAGLDFKLVQGEDFHLRIENDPFSPLVIESHYVGNKERLLYVTHYVESKQEKRLDSEAIFLLTSDGGLRLEETATQNPLGSGELRQREGGDRTFATAFARALLQQGYAAAAVEKQAVSVNVNSAELNTQPLSSIEPTTQKQIDYLSSDRPDTLVKKPQESLDPVDNFEPTSDSNETTTISLTTSSGENGGLTENTTESPPLPAIKSTEQKTEVEPQQQVLKIETEGPANQQPDLSDTDKHQLLASSLIQRTIEEHEPQLHLALTSEEPAVTVEVESLRDWYVAIKAQQAKGLSEKTSLLNIIKEKGTEAQKHGDTTLTSTQAATMTTDLQWFNNNHPKTTVGGLRTWYRANTSVANSSYTEEIKTIAQKAMSTGNDSTQLRPTDYQQMTREVEAFQLKVAAEIEPSLRSIWSIATSNQMVKQYGGNQLTFTGVNYSISSTTEGALTLTHNKTGSKLSIAESGKVIKNELTLDDAKTLQSISLRLQEVQNTKQPADIQA